jgi:hypothetical protein
MSERYSGHIQFSLVCAVLFFSSLPLQLACQTLQTSDTVQSRTFPISHLYWRFLSYQSFLDARASERDAQGKDGSWLRNDLQRRLQFSDADLVKVRVASARLTKRVAALDAEAARLRTFGSSPQITAQLKSLTQVRETDIDAEVMFLRGTLPPEKIQHFEAFLVQFFPQPHTAPNQLTEVQR